MKRNVIKKISTAVRYHLPTPHPESKHPSTPSSTLPSWVVQVPLKTRLPAPRGRDNTLHRKISSAKASSARPLQRHWSSGTSQDLTHISTEYVVDTGVFSRFEAPRPSSLQRYARYLPCKIPKVSPYTKHAIANFDDSSLDPCLRNMISSTSEPCASAPSGSRMPREFYQVMPSVAQQTCVCIAVLTIFQAHQIPD